MSRSGAPDSSAAAMRPVVPAARSERTAYRRIAVYLSVGLSSGAVIALQLAVMRIFAVGSWAHFGSLVVSLAMLSFGLVSVVLCAATAAVERHAAGIAAVAAVVFAPLVVGANLLAQQLPFNAVFLLADPQQKWRLLANFVLYLLPFIAAALFIGVIFIDNRRDFPRIYFADLSGAGIGGGLFFLAMYVLPPERLIVVPLLLGGGAAAIWCAANAGAGARTALFVALIIAAGLQFWLPPLLRLPVLTVSDYKGIAYARKFPDSAQVYRDIAPFGDLQIYDSSYLHFAPGLSDNAAFNVPPLPPHSFLGLYVDGDGPVGVIGDLPHRYDRYFHYLPMFYPYLLKREPDVFVVRFGGGISTLLALRAGARTVAIAETNPSVVRAFTADPKLRSFNGGILGNRNVAVVSQMGRLWLAGSVPRYDVIDLSLTSSFGLTSPGGFSVTESFDYTREAFAQYLAALRPGGILSVTVWNREEPPKSVLKLYASVVEAAHMLGEPNVAQSFFVVSNYLSTTTVLYKRGGFSRDELATLHAHSEAMSFDEVYSSDKVSATPGDASLLDAYRKQIFGAPDEMTQGTAATGALPVTAENLPATALARLGWQHLISGDWRELAARYPFDVRPLTDDRPYFAGYVKPSDLPRVLNRLGLLQDEWGYLSLWATLAVAAMGALVLVVLPVGLGGGIRRSDAPAALAALVYFACLGIGYIAVEIAAISKCTLALGNYTVSAAAVVPGMLVCSGVGSLLSGRLVEHARRTLPLMLAAIALVLLTGFFTYDIALGHVGRMPAAMRPIGVLLLLSPAALLMGFPMPVAMTMLARLGQDRMFVWAWGVNGCFSVVAAPLVPILGTAFGLSAALALAAAAYLIAIPAAYCALLPATRPGGGVPAAAAAA